MHILSAYLACSPGASASESQVQKPSTHQTVEACVDLGVLEAHLIKSGKSFPQAVLSSLRATWHRVLESCI